MKFRNTTNHRQFGINVSSNVLAYGVNLLIGLWLTPYLITKLGVESYGLYPLANSVTSYMSLITLALNGAYGRYLAIDMQRKAITDANKTFNTSLFGSIIITTISLPFVIGFVFAIPYVFNIPLGQENNTQILFFLIMISFFVTTIESCFSVSTWAKSRFDLQNIVIISSQLFRLLCIVIIFQLTNPNIWIVGLAMLLSSMLGLFGNFYFWRKLTPELRINYRHFDRSRVNDLFSMGGWMVVNQIGALLFQSTSLIIANISLGVKIAGEYGSIILFSSLLRGLSSTASSVLTPMVLEKYAMNDLSRISSLSTQAIRLLGITIGIPVGLICGFGKPILSLWLGESFSHLWLLLGITLIYLPFNLAVTPLFAIQTTLNKVKLPGIMSLIFGIINIFLALVFIEKFNLGAIGIAGAGAIVLTMKNALFTPIYGATIQKNPWYTYLKSLIPGLVVSISIIIISIGFLQFFEIDKWLELILLLGITSCISLLLIYVFVLKIEDKKFFQSFIPGFNDFAGK